MSDVPLNPLPVWWSGDYFSDLEFLQHLDGVDLYVASRQDCGRVFLQIGTRAMETKAGYTWTEEDYWRGDHVDAWDWSTPAIREFAKAFFALHQ